MSEIKVDTVVDAAGTGKPNFSNGVTMNGAALSTLNLGQYTASSSEPSSPENGAIWWDTTNEKIFIYIAGEWKETIGIAAGISWGGARGFRLGGTSSNIIEYFDIQNSGNATDFGDISGTQSVGGGACGNTSRICQALGFNNISGSFGYINNIEYITSSTTGNSTDFGDLTEGRGDNFACSNGTRGVFMGGYTSSGKSKTMDYITIATLGNAIDFGDLYGYVISGTTYDIRNKTASISNATRGLTCGGASEYSGAFNGIQYITIATTGNAQDFGDLTRNVAETSGCSDTTRGLVMGGSGGTGGSGNLSNVIEYITVDTTGNATDFGDTTYTSQGAASSSDGTYGCHYGGYGVSFAQVNTIDRVTIQTTGNATDHGDLTHTNGIYTQGASGNAS